MLNGQMIWNGLKAGFLIIGTTIGAGFASGREIWEFFASYGSGSSLFLLLSLTLFSLCCYMILTLSSQLKAANYMLVLEKLIGRSLARVYDFFILIYLLSMTVIMFAGSGATLQYWSISYWLGVALIGLLVLLVFIKGISGIMSLNSILIPILIMTLILACLMFRWAGHGETAEIELDSNILSSAIAFAAFNILPMIAVLSAVGSKLRPVEIKIASYSSAIGLCLVGFLYNETLLRISKEIILYEVPLYAILRYSSAEFTVLVSGVLWVAIYTTAISGIFGITSRFTHLPLPQWVLAALLILLIIPLTRFGFSNLVNVLYPLYGILNLFILAMILLYPLARLKK